MKIRVSEKEMDAIHTKLFEKYPFLQRNNIAYTASLVSFYDVSFDERFKEDILSIIGREE